ncbi:MAG: hypothetical protein PHO37_09170 [Kiritimatiellae bacterium]|nr:hypothetical protein [Kiritimatiellia bacterium]
MSSRYLQLNLFNQAFAAYPKGLRLSGDIWQNYPLRGGRRLRFLLRTLNYSCADRFLLCTSEIPLKRYGFDTESFFAWITEVLHEPCCLCFFWPSPKRSTGRFYAYAVEPSGNQIVAYIKFAISNNDSEALYREINASKELNEKGTKCFRIPKCLAHTSINNKCLVAVFEPLPPNSKKIKFTLDSWVKVIGLCKNEFSNEIHTVDIAKLGNERWYNSFVERSDVCSPFVTAVKKTFKSGVDVCRTHGDFACHNFMSVKESLWIFDWEEFTEHGPCLADEICFFLCVRRFEMGWPMEKVFYSFICSYLEKGDVVWRRALQALAFLFGLKISMGKEMVDYWNQNHKFFDLPY